MRSLKNRNRLQKSKTRSKRKSNKRSKRRTSKRIYKKFYDSAAESKIEKSPSRLKKETDKFIEINGDNYPIVEYSLERRYGRTDYKIGEGGFKKVYIGIDFKNEEHIAWNFIDLKKIDELQDSKENKRIKRKRIVDEINLLNKYII